MTADGPEEKDLLSRSPFGVSASICMGMREGTRESKTQTPNIGSSDESRRLPIDLHVKRSFCVIRVVSGCVLEYINEGGHCAIMTKLSAVAHMSSAMIAEALNAALLWDAEKKIDTPTHLEMRTRH